MYSRGDSHRPESSEEGAEQIFSHSRVSILLSIAVVRKTVYPDRKHEQHKDIVKGTSLQLIEIIAFETVTPF